MNHRRLLCLSLCVAAARSAVGAVSVPPGFEVQLYASGPELSYVTTLAFDQDGALYVGEANVLKNTGRVLRARDESEFVGRDQPRDRESPRVLGG